MCWFACRECSGAQRDLWVKCKCDYQYASLWRCNQCIYVHWEYKEKLG